MGVVECYAGVCVVVAHHRCQFGFGWCVVLVVGVVYGVVVGAVECGEDIHGYDDCGYVGPSVSFHRDF